jgi:hypothetical protein
VAIWTLTYKEISKFVIVIILNWNFSGVVSAMLMIKWHNILTGAYLENWRIHYGEANRTIKKVLHVTS